jgi:hypothetical protein
MQELVMQEIEVAFWSDDDGARSRSRAAFFAAA